MVLTPFLLTLALLGTVADDAGCVANQPCYTAASIANSAANVAGYYAPNSFLSIYGTNLANVTKVIGLNDIGTGTLPVSLQGTGVGVLIGGIAGYVYYVSPGQVNVLIPEAAHSGSGDDTSRKPQHLWSRGSDHAHGDSSGAVPTGRGERHRHAWQRSPSHAPIPRESPARSWFCTRLASGNQRLRSSAGPSRVAAWPVANRGDFQVQLNGIAVDPKSIQYVGDTPGFAGLFQINLRLPANSPPNPEIRIGFTGSLSPPAAISSRIQQPALQPDFVCYPSTASGLHYEQGGFLYALARTSRTGLGSGGQRCRAISRPTPPAEPSAAPRPKC